MSYLPIRIEDSAISETYVENWHGDSEYPIVNNEYYGAYLCLSAISYIFRDNSYFVNESVPEVPGRPAYAISFISPISA